MPKKKWHLSSSTVSDVIDFLTPKSLFRRTCLYSGFSLLLTTLISFAIFSPYWVSIPMIISAACFVMFIYLRYKEKRLPRTIPRCSETNKYNTDNKSNNSNHCNTLTIARTRTKEISNSRHTNTKETSKNSKCTKNSKKENNNTNDKK